MSQWWFGEPPERDPEAQEIWERANTSEPRPGLSVREHVVFWVTPVLSVMIVITILLGLLDAFDALPLGMRAIVMQGYIQLIWIAVFLVLVNMWLRRRFRRR